jgi:predicted 2-oxoglutarate/Fe(II)-dependent dioxygenase YbiX
MQREIAERLHTIAPPGSFAVQRSAPADALRIDVQGVGALDLPLAPRTVSRLRDVAKPARYGLRDRTVYDPTVRDSREIAKSRIRIDRRRWNATLIPLLDDIRAGLGLAEGVVLKAELHNMLLYERGQFFKSHQDSEKADGMIGTLVITLPSSFRGGEMTVEQHGEVMAFRGSRSDVQLVAFYADRRHEVRPVTAGARVVLTYNLRTEGVAAAMPPQAEPHTIDALAGALQRHFETPRGGRLGGEATPPDRLVYLLDHEYTARGLRWDLLKGADAPRASALRTAAGRLDCEVFLAQADVHETWQCESDPDD